MSGDKPDNYYDDSDLDEREKRAEAKRVEGGLSRTPAGGALTTSIPSTVPKVEPHTSATKSIHFIIASIKTAICISKQEPSKKKTKVKRPNKRC